MVALKDIFLILYIGSNLNQAVTDPKIRNSSLGHVRQNNLTVQTEIMAGESNLINENNWKLQKPP